MNIKKARKEFVELGGANVTDRAISAFADPKNLDKPHIVQCAPRAGFGVYHSSSCDRKMVQAALDFTMRINEKA